MGFDWRAALLRRLARRFHIGEDVLRHLSTWQRFGERFEIEAPTEMVPIGARTVARALRTRAAPQIRPDWLWPYWLERQLDPRSPSFTPRGHLPFLTNVTHRNWTAVGDPDSGYEGVVDPAGLVTVVPDSWSLDWWVADGETWVLPSRQVEPRQRLVDATPVVQTTVDLPAGGEVRCQCRFVRGTVLVEVASDVDRPVSVAFAIRPYNPEGLAVVEDIRVETHRIVLDGRVAVLLPQPPARTVASTFHDGDCLHILTGGDATPGGRLAVRDPAGLAQAAVVYDVPPGGSARVLLPVPPPKAKDGTVPVAMPDVADHTARWRGLLDRGMRVRLPDRRLQEAVDANRGYLLVLHDPGSITAGPLTYHRFWFRDAAYQLVAMDRWGLHAEAADVLATYPRRQRHDGFFYSQWREWDANGAAIWAIAEHHRLTRDEALLQRLLPAVRRGVAWFGRHRRRDGLLPPGVSAEHLGPFDVYYWDDFWALRGLRDGAYLFDVAGDEPAARQVRQTAAEYLELVLASARHASRHAARPYLPAGPNRRVDAGMIGSLVACHPLELLPPDDPLVAGTTDLIRERFTEGPAFFQAISHTGLGTYLTLQLGFVELYAGDPRAFDRLDWLLDAATGTYTWPEAIHPRTGGGCMGDGHHGWAAAELLSFVRAVLLRDLPGDGDLPERTAVLPVLPPGWRGESVEVTGAPTSGGRLSYRLTWDGAEPTLSWHWDGAPRLLTAPALDPGWSSTDASGKVRLPSGRYAGAGTPGRTTPPR